MAPLCGIGLAVARCCIDPRTPNAGGSISPGCLDAFFAGRPDSMSPEPVQGPEPQLSALVPAVVCPTGGRHSLAASVFDLLVEVAIETDFYHPRFQFRNARSLVNPLWALECASVNTFPNSTTTVRAARQVKPIARRAARLRSARCSDARSSIAS
jgi:hypothetical protein